MRNWSAQTRNVSVENPKNNKSEVLLPHQKELKTSTTNPNTYQAISLHRLTTTELYLNLSPEDAIKDFSTKTKKVIPT